MKLKNTLLLMPKLSKAQPKRVLVQNVVVASILTLLALSLSGPLHAANQSDPIYGKTIDFLEDEYNGSDILDRGVDANLPELGDASATVLSALDEQRIAEQIMMQVARSDQVVQDPEITDYLTRLGNRLAKSGPSVGQQFIFFVVKDPTINAFAMPGGVIGVHTGLVLASNSESELAGVLGHEIGHVTQHHLARMLEGQKNATFKNLAGIALALLVARSNPNLAQGAMAASTAFGVQTQLDYTRAHEREADRVGLQILSNANFNVRGMPAFFKTLQQGNRFSEGSAPSFLRTHPLTAERIADVTNRVDQMPYRQVVDSIEYQYVRAKIKAKGNFLDRNGTRSSLRYFKQMIKERRYANEAVAHYGLAQAYLTKHDVAKAAVEAQWLKANAPQHPMIENLLADVAVAQDNPVVAAMQYETALKKYPSTRALIYGYATHFLRIKQLDQLLSFVEKKQEIFPNDAYLYDLKARAYTMQHKQLLRHQAQGEAYYRQYDLARAIEQMDLAAKANDGDFYQHSIVEARLKTLKRIQGDEERGHNAP